MATTTRKPAQPPSGATRRSATAASAVASPPVPSSSSSSDIRDDAAYAIGYQAGLIEGQRIGAERERAALYTEESITERIERLMALEIRPRALRALDHVVSWLLYAAGIAGIVAAAVIIWRLSKWI